VSNRPEASLDPSVEMYEASVLSESRAELEVGDVDEPKRPEAIHQSLEPTGDLVWSFRCPGEGVRPGRKS
jgi:hypothetical protein